MRILPWLLPNPSLGVNFPTVSYYFPISKDLHFQNFNVLGSRALPEFQNKDLGLMD